MSFDSDNPYYKQVSLLVQVLPFLAGHACFALKGGTAINLFVQDFPRLSVDIDLVYLPLEERDTALENITLELSLLAKIIEERLPLVSVTQDIKRGKLLVDSSEASIKLEVNLNMRGTVLPVVETDIVAPAEQLFGFASVQMLHTKELYAGKMVAALDRQHPRDLFDVKHFLEKGLLDSAQLDLFLVYVLSSGRAIADILDPHFKDIENLYKDHFKGMTIIETSLLDLIQAREKLLMTIKKLMTEKQKEFLLSVKAAKPDWHLFTYPEISELPAVKFKIHNINKMSESKRRDSFVKLERALYG